MKSVFERLRDRIIVTQKKFLGSQVEVSTSRGFHADTEFQSRLVSEKAVRRARAVGLVDVKVMFGDLMPKPKFSYGIAAVAISVVSINYSSQVMAEFNTITPAPPALECLQDASCGPTAPPPPLCPGNPPYPAVSYLGCNQPPQPVDPVLPAPPCFDELCAPPSPISPTCPPGQNLSPNGSSCIAQLGLPPCPMYPTTEASDGCVLPNGVPGSARICPVAPNSPPAPYVYVYGNVACPVSPPPPQCPPNFVLAPTGECVIEMVQPPRYCPALPGQQPVLLPPNVVCPTTPPAPPSPSNNNARYQLVEPNASGQPCPAGTRYIAQRRKCLIINRPTSGATSTETPATSTQAPTTTQSAPNQQATSTNCRPGTVYNARARRCLVDRNAAKKAFCERRGRRWVGNRCR